nr:hypothetical protein [Tanacetum cinerariifolium]
MHNNSQGKKQEVKDQRRSIKLSKNKTSVIACNDSLNAKTLNVKSVSAMCDKCVLIDKHAMCVLNSVGKPIKKTVAFKSNQKPKNFTRKLYEHVSKTCSWWYSKFTPSGYKWKPKSEKDNVNPNLVEIVLFIVDSGCLKYMTGNLKLLINFVEKFMGTVKFGNDQIAPILGYGDLVQGAVTIKKVYYVEGLNHNLLSVGQFCDADLVVAFRKSTCFIRDLKGNDLLTASINRKRYVLVIVDDYFRYTWTHFLRSKNETPEVLIKFLRLVQRGLQAQVRMVQTDKGTEILNQTLLAYLAAEGIHHQTSVAQTPKQNGKPSVKFFHIFGSICYIVRDGENLDKMKEKGDECIFVGLSPAIQCQANVPQADMTVTTSNELDLLFSPMFDELLNGSPKVVSKSFAVCSADAPNQCQHHTTPLNNNTTPVPTSQVPTLAPTVTSSENINQSKTYAENDQVANNEFINIFCTPVQDQGETSSCHVDLSNMHTFYQRYPSKHRWTKDHPLEQVIGNPSQSVRTRRQLDWDAEMCMFALTVSRTKPKNIKKAMTDLAWIESMQKELHQFDRLDVWELVDRPLCINVITQTSSKGV